MKARKWMALVATGGLLLQAGACSSSLADYILPLLIQQILPAILAGATGTA